MPDQPDPQRIQKLEETVAHNDHLTNALSVEIHELNKTVLQLVSRLSRLESRLIDLNAKLADDPGLVPPPHSAGPDIPREPL